MRVCKNCEKETKKILVDSKTKEPCYCLKCLKLVSQPYVSIYEADGLNHSDLTEYEEKGIDKEYKQACGFCGARVEEVYVNAEFEHDTYIYGCVKCLEEMDV